MYQIQQVFHQLDQSLVVYKKLIYYVFLNKNAAGPELFLIVIP